jgi:hypothetical protein
MQDKRPRKHGSFRDGVGWEGVLREEYRNLESFYTGFTVSFPGNTHDYQKKKKWKYSIQKKNILLENKPL